MPKNRFFDDENIIPSEQPVEPSPTPENITPEVVPTPIPITPIEEQKEIPEVITPIQPQETPKDPTRQLNDLIGNIKQDNYMEIIKEYQKNKDLAPNRQQELTNMLDQTYGQKKVPMFKMIKDAEGNITVEPKDPTIVIPTEDPKNNVQDNTKQCVKEMLDKTSKDLTKATIEVKIYVELCNMEVDADQKKIYQQQLNILKNEVKYQQNRKNILERML